MHLRLNSLHSDNTKRHAEISLSRINSIAKHAIILSFFHIDCLSPNVPNVINPFPKMTCLFEQLPIEDSIQIVFVVINAIVY